jgi:HEPN superfamily AbiU2-like protein
MTWFGHSVVYVHHHPPFGAERAEMTQDIEIFANYCVFMRSIYLHARELFETSSPDDRYLMEATAGAFFGDLNQVLKEYIILQVCKITDQAQDFRNNDNQTIDFLLQHYDFSDDPPILERLNQLRADMQAFRAKLLPARNKLISHSDRDSILAGRPLGAASDEEWNQFWVDLQDLINIVHRKVTGSSFYLNGVAGQSDAGDLLKVLRRGGASPATHGTAATRDEAKAKVDST